MDYTIYKIQKDKKSGIRQHKVGNGIYDGKVFPLTTPEEIKLFIRHIMSDRDDWHIKLTDVLSDLFIMLDNFRIKAEYGGDKKDENDQSK